MKKNKATFQKKFKYFFDTTLSSGTTSLMGWLGIASLIIIFFATFVVLLFKIPDDDKGSFSFFEALWLSLMRILDAGSVSNDNNWPLRFVMLVVTMAGIFVFSILIGILTSLIQEKLFELRKGRSTVLEENHIVILGWSTKIIPILVELVNANEMVKDACIVIMAEKDKVEMEDEILKKINLKHKVRIICRTGNTIDPHDLETVSSDTARSIIILSPENEMADMFVIKTMLAIVSNPHRKPDKYHIVAEIEDEEKLEIARIVGKDEATFVYANDLIAKIILQSCRHAGLSIIYQNLLSFSGSEIYFFIEPNLVGKPFREAMFAYDDAVIIGICHGAEGVDINPDLRKVIGVNDRIIGIAENESSKHCIPSIQHDIAHEYITFKAHSPRKVEKTLILGWNKKGNSIIQQIDKFLIQGSEITIVTHLVEAEKDFEKVKDSLTHQKINFIINKTTDKRILYKLDIPSYDHVIVLAYSDQMDVQEADASTLITLLYLRQIAQACNYSFSIVSEMIDSRNRQLMINTKADDFIVSNKIISLMIAQLAENHTLDRVFSDLFDVQGSEIYLRPSTNYIKTGELVDFYTITESAIEHKEIAIGYCLHEERNNPEVGFGIVLNPKKSQKIIFNEMDNIIVISKE